MDIIYFGYSAAFLALGLAIALRAESTSPLGFSLPLNWLAGFGFLHGLREAMVLWSLIHSNPLLLNLYATVVNISSLICLIEFGRRLSLITLSRDNAKTNIYEWYLSPWIYPALLLLVASGVFSSSSFFEGVSAWIRIFLLAPGAWLAAMGCIRFAILRIGHPSINSDFPGQFYAWMSTGAAFIAYGVFGGLIFDGSPCLSAEEFSGLFGIPVEVFRATCAIWILVSLMQVLKFFHIELMRKVSHAQESLGLALSSHSEIHFRTEALLNLVTEGVICIDLHGNVEFANPLALLMLGYEYSEINGKNFHRLCHRDAQGHEISFDQCNVEGSIRGGVVNRSDNAFFQRKNGTCAQVSYRSAPILDGKKILGGLIIFSEA